MPYTCCAYSCLLCKQTFVQCCCCFHSTETSIFLQQGIYIPHPNTFYKVLELYAILHALVREESVDTSCQKKGQLLHHSGMERIPLLHNFYSRNFFQNDFPFGIVSGTKFCSMTIHPLQHNFSILFLTIFLFSNKNRTIKQCHI